MRFKLEVKQVNRKTGKYAIFSTISEKHKTVLGCLKHSLDICRTLGNYSDYYSWLNYITHLISREIEDVESGIKVPEKFNYFETSNGAYDYFVGITIN